jgi:hypothetical protein
MRLDDIKDTLGGLKTFADMGQKHIKVFQDFLTENLIEHCRIVAEGVNPNCIDVLIYGYYLRVRVELTLGDDSIKSSIAAYNVSPDGETETPILFLGYDDRMNMFDTENNRLSVEAYPRYILSFILTKNVTTFKP